MNGVYEGEEWKHVKAPAPCAGQSLRPFDRAERQRRVDDAYGHGRIGAYDWDRITTLLSDVGKWKEWTDTEVLP